MSKLLKQIEESVIAGDGPGTKGLAAEAVEAGVAAGDVLKKAMAIALNGI